MKNLVLRNSFVKHIKYNPFKRPEQPYIEGEGNIAKGWVKGSSVRVHFRNSHGDKSHVVGRVLRIGRLWLLSGCAFGYKDFRKGRPCIAIMWRGKNYMHLRVPAANWEYLAIRIGYKFVEEKK
jgi:hypothetical protein